MKDYVVIKMLLCILNEVTVVKFCESNFIAQKVTNEVMP